MAVPTISNLTLNRTFSFNGKSISNVTTHSLSFSVTWDSRVPNVLVYISVNGSTQQTTLINNGAIASFELGSFDAGNSEMITITIEIAVDDRRNGTRTQVYNFDVYKYSPPDVTASVMRNDNEQVVLTFIPSYQATVAGASNTLSIFWARCNVDGEVYETDLKGKTSPQVLVGTYDLAKAYQFTIAIKDSVRPSAIIKRVILPSAMPVMDIGADGKTVTFFGTSPNSADKNTLRVGEYNIEDTTSEYLFIVGNGTADNARENALGVTHTGHIDVQKNIYINTNGSGIFERDTDGTNRELIAMDGNNKLSIGYGQYSHGGRETVLQGGNKLTFRLKNPNATWRPYMSKGYSFNTTIQVGGYITNSGKDVTFQLPLNNPVIGNPTVTIASVDGLCVRQNNKYLYGSAASTFAKPSSYSCTLVNGGNHIKIAAKMANTTNVENNSACGIYASIKVTFS